VYRICDLNAKLHVMFDLDQEEFESAAERMQGTQAQLFADNPALPWFVRDLARSLNHFAEDLGATIFKQELAQIDLSRVFRTRFDSLDLIPSIWPVRGPVSSWFGYRRNPVTGRGQIHTGVDIRAKTGTPVRAPAAGTVTFVDWDGGYGKCVIVQHDGRLSTRYAHLSGYAVKLGQYVRRGQIIGYVGATGRTTGSHLHYEVLKRGAPVDPKNYLL